MKNKILLFAVVVALGFVVVMIMLPTHSGNVEEYKQKEFRYQTDFALQRSEIQSLKLKISKLEESTRQAWDSVEVVNKKKQKVKVVYLAARSATDAKPDSTNLAAEVLTSRELVDLQEDHINALLDYSTKVGAELAESKKLIQAQDSLLGQWPARYANMLDQKDAEIKEQRKQKNKWKIAVVAVVVIEGLRIIFSP